MPAVARSISSHDTAERRKRVAPALPDVHLIRGMPDLLDALRERRDEVGITLERLDDIAGFPSGYSAKLLAPVAIKNLGWLSFGCALDALGVALVMVENVEQRKLVQKRWIRRERPRNAPAKLRARVPATNQKPLLEIENIESIKIA
jgi:hypothetical protein